MTMVKIAVTVEEKTAEEMDRLVASGRYPSRSKIVQIALGEILRDSKKLRLAAECAKLDPLEEQRMAEEFIEDESWPEY